MSLYFALKQSNTRKLEDLFWAVSDPNSLQYGNHLSIDEITKIVQPSKECVERVTAWLMESARSDGVPDTNFNANGDILFVPQVSTKVVERLLNVQLSYFRHPRHPHTIPHALGGYTVPTNVASCLDVVGGVSMFPQVGTRQRTPQKHRARMAVRRSAQSLRNWPDDDCHICLQGEVTPNVIKAAFNITNSTIVLNTKSSMAIANGDGPDGYWEPSDLKSFFEGCSLPSSEAVVSKVFGTNKPDECHRENACLEASGDIQVAKGVSPMIPLQVWITNGDYLTWATNVANTEDAALVHSYSAGDPEINGAGSKEFQTRTNTEIQKCGLRGISILIASGDMGVMEIDRKYNPSFPSQTPYATCVGGSVFADPTHVGRQNGWEGSGGGFSWYFDRPSYQDEVVSAYLSSGVEFPSSSYWHRDGRGVPDVATLAGQPDPNDICMLKDGQVQQFAGTSASSPMFAAMVARLNSVRLAKGGKPLGFLNPWLYGVAKNRTDAFQDIVEGYNPTPRNNDDEVYRSTRGFHATTGWDAVTGLGAPNIEVLAELV